MRDRRLPATTVVAALCLAAAAWIGFGDLALADNLPGARRVGLLPSMSLLAVLVAASIGGLALARMTRDQVLPLWVAALALVPWLPVPLPAAALVWARPLGLLVVVGAAAASWAARTPGEASAGLRSWIQPPRAPRAAFVVAFVVYLSVGWRVSPVLPGGDEPHYLIITQSLLSDGDLAIENNHAQRDYLAYADRTLKPDFLKRGADGRIYSIHLPGVSVLVAPAFALGGYALAKVWLSLLAAAASLVAWRLAFLVTGCARAAWFAWAAAALSAPFLFLAFTVYPDGPGSLLVAVSLLAVVSLSQRSGRRPSWWLWTGLAPAALPWMHPRFSVLAASLGLVCAGRALQEARRVRALGAFLVLPAASAVAWFGYYVLIYGSPNPSVAYGHYTQMAASNAGRGLVGLFADQQFGLVAAAPVFLLALTGLVALARSNRRLALEWLLIVGPYTIVSAMYHMWWGGHSSPARFLGPVMLACVMPIAAARHAGVSVSTRTVHAVLLAVSLALAGVLAWVDGGRLVFNTRDGLALWAVWASRTVDVARGLPSVFRTDAATALTAASIWVGSGAAVWAAVRWAESRLSLSRGVCASLVVAGLLIAATASMTATWRLDRASGLAAANGQLHLLTRASSGAASMGLVYDPIEIGAPADVVRHLRVDGSAMAGRPAWAWFWLPGVPAGRYRVWFDVRQGGAPIDIDLVIGRGDAAVETWRTDAAAPGRVSREFDLPRAVRSIALRGTAEAHARVRRITLEPVAVADVGDLRGPLVTAARRYGQTVVMAVGEDTFLEGPGLWTAALKTAEMAIVAPAGQAVQRVRLRAGPVVTDVALEAGEWRWNARLPAGAVGEAAIPLAAAAPTTTLRVRTSAGFRPAQFDPASTDMRHLGVWVEFY